MEVQITSQQQIGDYVWSDMRSRIVRLILAKLGGNMLRLIGRGMGY
jgi:hypothetical protein